MELRHETAGPFAAGSIRANSGLLLALARRLDAADSIEPFGAAKAQLLLTGAALRIL